MIECDSKGEALASIYRHQYTGICSRSIYKNMIRPILLYCYPLQLALPQGTVSKLQCIQDRAARIVSPRAKIESWDSIEKIRNTRVPLTCLNHYIIYYPKTWMVISKDSSMKQTLEAIDLVLSYRKCTQKLERSHLHTRELACSTDLKKNPLLRCQKEIKTSEVFIDFWLYSI